MAYYNVKCYLVSNENKNRFISANKLDNDIIEIKRFKLSSINNDYLSLINEIYKQFKNHFNSIDEIETYWLDDENEFICFDTNGEYMDYVNHLLSKTFTFDIMIKIYIRKKVFKTLEAIPIADLDDDQDIIYNRLLETMLDLIPERWRINEFRKETHKFETIINELLNRIDLVKNKKPFSRAKINDDRNIDEFIKKAKSKNVPLEFLVNLLVHNNGNLNSTLEALSID